MGVVIVFRINHGRTCSSISCVLLGNLSIGFIVVFGLMLIMVGVNKAFSTPSDKEDLSGEVGECFKFAAILALLDLLNVKVSRQFLYQSKNSIDKDRLIAGINIVNSDQRPDDVPHRSVRLRAAARIVLLGAEATAVVMLLDLFNAWKLPMRLTAAAGTSTVAACLFNYGTKIAGVVCNRNGSDYANPIGIAGGLLESLVEGAENDQETGLPQSNASA